MIFVEFPCQTALLRLQKKINNSESYRVSEMERQQVNQISQAKPTLKTVLQPPVGHQTYLKIEEVKFSSIAYINAGVRT